MRKFIATILLFIVPFGVGFLFPLAQSSPVSADITGMNISVISCSINDIRFRVDMFNNQPLVEGDNFVQWESDFQDGQTEMAVTDATDAFTVVLVSNTNYTVGGQVTFTVNSITYRDTDGLQAEEFDESATCLLDEGDDDARPFCDTNETCTDTGLLECNQVGGRAEDCRSILGIEGNCCIPASTEPPEPLPDGPFPSPYIPCEETDLPEFHSLRPYQASPCYTELTQQDLYCGNDIITRRNYKVTPASAESCDVSGNSTTCYYEIDEEVLVNIDLTNAELPIAGNTQLVSNQVNQGNPQPERLLWPTLVNEYLSWWLNGTTYRAEDYLHFHPGVRPGIGAIVDYSGPIKKLYPRFMQFSERSDQQGAAYSLRHNQIYMCIVNDFQVPCYWDFTLQQYIWDAGTPNDPNDDIGLGPIRLRGGGATPESPYMPFSGTDDRLGMVFTGIVLIDPLLGIDAQPEQEDGVEITNLEFIPEDGRGADLLYFPHMIENVELTDLLQNTFASKTVAKTEFSGWGEGTDLYYTYRCDLEDVRWNPGDDLFGEIENADRMGQTNFAGAGQEITGEEIQGTVSYTTNFSCTWDVSGESGFCPSGFCQPNCVQPCQTDPTNVCVIDPGSEGYPDTYGCCLAQCDAPMECEKEALTATSVYTRTPQAMELWDRTVSGSQSLVKRILPKLGHFGMWDEIKDLPAVTSARYYTDDPDHDILAGDPDNNRSGAAAELFIPHFGGIKVYTLDTIQDTLRPQEMSSLADSFSLNPNGDPGEVSETCTYTDAQVNSAMQAAANRYGIPVSMLQAIFEIEGLDFIVDYQNDGQQVYRCDENAAGAAGLMQVVGPSNPNADSYTDITCGSERMATSDNPRADLGVCNSPDGALSRCDVDDIFELAARVIMTKVGLWNSNNCTTNGDRFPANFASVYNASCRYYGQFEADSSTHNYAEEFGNALMPNPLRNCSQSELDDGEYCMNYCDIVCNKMGTCGPTYPDKEQQ